jgi:hypothetical protein
MVLSAHQQARQLVEEAVAKHGDAWAAAIGTTATAQFRDDVAGALNAAIRAHIAEQYRRYERASDLREDYLKLVNLSTQASKKLRQVQAVLDSLPPMQHDPGFRIHSPIVMAHDLDRLLEAARRLAEKCRSFDRGGPAKMEAFEALAKGLICAYRRATGKSGAGRTARQGRLLDLAEAVLPMARKIARAVTGKPIRAPADDALGEQLHRIARRRI